MIRKQKWVMTIAFIQPIQFWGCVHGVADAELRLCAQGVPSQGGKLPVSRFRELREARAIKRKCAPRPSHRCPPQFLVHRHLSCPPQLDGGRGAKRGQTGLLGSRDLPSLNLS